MPRPWTHRESLFLLQAAERCGLPWCASELHRNVEDCARHLDGLKGAPEGDGWLMMREAARLASCSDSTIRNLVRKGRLTAKKNAQGYWVVRREDVIACAEEAQRKAEGPVDDSPEPCQQSRMSETGQKGAKIQREEAPAEKCAQNAPDAKISPSEAENGKRAETDGLPEGWITVEAYAEAAGITRAEAVKRCQGGRVSCRMAGRRWLVSADEAVMAKARKPEPDRCVPAEALGGMSRLDILKAFASGAMVGGLRA